MSSFPLTPIQRNTMDFGANALAAPTTPGRRLPVVDRSKVDPELVKAAEGMEATFLNYMMKVMRETVPQNDMDLENSASQLYRGLRDEEISHQMARGGGIGLADQLIAYIEAERYTLPRGQGVPTRAESAPVVESARSTGGTHEGQSVRK